MDKSVKDRTIEFVKYKGITMKSFEIKCGLSTGYVTSMRKGFGLDKLNNVLTAFPELNRDWLLYGEGEMIKSVNSSPTLDKAIDEIAEQRKLVAKSQEQIDRLLAIIEKMQAI